MDLVKPDQRDCIIILDEMALKAQTLVEKNLGGLLAMLTMDASRVKQMKTQLTMSLLYW